jgi:hypothetical protein
MVIVLATEDVEVHLHALQTMTEQFQLYELGHCHLGKVHCCLEIMFDHGMHLIIQHSHMLPCSNSAMKGNNATNRIL